MPKKKFNQKTQPIQKTRVPNPMMQRVMEKLQAAQQADSNWEKAIEKYVSAEAAISPKDDPAEGQIVVSKIIPPKKGM